MTPATRRGGRGVGVCAFRLVGRAAPLLCLIAAGCATFPFAGTAVEPLDGPRPEAPATPRLPRDAARFEIRQVGDSTVAFAREEAAWLHAGQVGIAVDPSRRDALVARLRLLDVAADGTVRALITGQTTRVTSAHVVLLAEPAAPAWRQRAFWFGALGGALGALFGVALLR